MAVAKGLPPTDPFFVQKCPLCGTPQRMMIKGNYVKDNKWERYPDMGYSFCNCRDIFYTKWENIVDGNTTWNNCEDLVGRLRRDFEDVNVPKEFTISMLDVYFIDWNRPHEMFHWICRKVYYLIDAESFASLCKEIGFEVVTWWRDMDVNSKTPQHFHITVRKNT